jgi:hypothetical protein
MTVRSQATRGLPVCCQSKVWSTTRLLGMYGALSSVLKLKSASSAPIV